MKEKINLALIGCSGRGMGLLWCLLGMSDVNVTAVCDLYEDRVKNARKAVKSKRKTEPFTTLDYKEVLLRPDVDAVVIATAWEAHIEIAIAAMRAGKFAATEVGGAYELKDCFDLVSAYEETGVHCMMLENCCYGEYELMVLNMVKEGLFGEVVHCEGGYCHDLRSEIANGKENRHYRLRNYIARNCENYPTHELGPIAKVLNINNGNRFLTLASFSSNAKGLKEYVRKKKADDKELMATDFKQGDIVTTVMTTEKGQTVTLTLDTTLPRTYSRHFTVRGTKAAYFEDNNSLFIDGRHNIFDLMPTRLWNNAKKLRRKYAHPLWNRKNKKYRKYGHGGMDYFVLKAMVETVKTGAYPPIDTYDTALWMAVTPLSEESINNGNITVDIPDFTKGGWKRRHTGVLPEYDLDSIRKY